LDDDEFMDVVEKVVVGLDPVFVSLSGGEPLTRANRVVRAVRRIKADDIEVHLNTNALLLTPALCTELRDIDKFNINLDGIDAGTHNALRGSPQAFEVLMEKLALLGKYVDPKRISIATVVTVRNFRNLTQLASFVAAKGYGEFHLLDMIPTANNERELLPSRAEWLEFYGLFSEVEKTGVRIKPNHALLFLSRFLENVGMPFCMAGRLKMVICANGNIVPCNYFKEPEFVCGNAREHDLLDVWRNSPTMLQFRSDADVPAGCESCSQRSRCAGGCRALARNLTGSAFAQDPYCSVYRLNNATY
jgi:pyrroloquinoline quinone biosynthesis protein E